MEDIRDYFISLLEAHKSVDIAESEFKRAIADDDSLRQQYRQWCHEVGSSEKNGFTDFCHEFMAESDEVWQSLNDYDE